MSNDKLLNISVNVAGRSYPLSVNNNEEAEAIRSIETQLNEDLGNLMSRYGSKMGKPDIMGMLLLTYAKKLYDLNQDPGSTAVEDKVNEILMRLDSALLHK